MEKVTKPGNYHALTSPSSLAMRKDSHVITKLKPKIRIVHIFAPKIIKTDAANFRELVQRLTGKPAVRSRSSKKSNGRTTRGDMAESQEGSWCKEEVSAGCVRRVKEKEGGMWGGETSGLFGGLGDLDGFMKELGEFPINPLISTRMDSGGFGEMHLLGK